MKFIFRFLKIIFIFTFLTILSQVGGTVYLIYKPFGLKIQRTVKSPLKNRIARFGLFWLMMSITSLIIAPPIAKKFGRVPLPIYATVENPIKSINWLTVLMNRHYVRPKLKETILEITHKMKLKYSGMTLIYMDANFPFLNHFPLLPHLSHHDGKKLDIAFIYENVEDEKLNTYHPSWLGYGYSESPKSNEYNQPEKCRQKGFWMYNILSKLNLENNKYQFDNQANKNLILTIIRHPQIQKIFIEPHLKHRLGLNRYSKICFQGCHSVRHDDHIHLQIY